jgi:hypothetical protein
MEEYQVLLGLVHAAQGAVNHAIGGAEVAELKEESNKQFL